MVKAAAAVVAVVAAGAWMRMDHLSGHRLNKLCLLIRYRPQSGNLQEERHHIDRKCRSKGV